MSQAIDPALTQWTAADLVERFGPIPLWRIRFDPPPGSATEEDVIEIHSREKRLCELVDGVLVEKTVGTYESYLAVLIVRLMGNFVADNDLGIVLGADGILRLMPGLVRIPDGCFISWDRLPNQTVPDQAIGDLVPNLAVEVISRSNTRKEMDDKLHDYFGVGVDLVWYVYPESHEVHVFTSPNECSVLSERDALEGGTSLPGLKISLADLFAKPGPNK